jgi:hypothetical protein
MTEGRAMHLVPHPHWDREWYEPFQRFRLRLAGGELALTVARCTGALSRNVHRYREQPAGPQIPIPAAQLVGTTRAARRVRPGAQPSTDPATGIRLTRRIWLSARRPAQDVSRMRLDG